MYLINPLYFISNVIYIKPENSYILIEKSCWNTMIHLIFKHKKPKPQELRAFKHLCYSVYVTYQGTGTIDYSFFNSQVSLLQDKEEEFDLFLRKTRMVVPENKDSVVEIEVNEETFFDDEFICEGSNQEFDVLSQEEVKNISKTLTLRDHLEDEFNEIINYYLAYSEETNKLVNYIGFGRLKSQFRVLLSNGQLSTNKFEYQFFKFIPHLIDKAIISHGLSKYFYFCDYCCSINCHDFIRSGFLKGEKLSYKSELHKNMVNFYIQGVPYNKFKTSMKRTDLIKQFLPQSDFSFNTVNLDQLFNGGFFIGQYLKLSEDNLSLVIDITYNRIPYYKGFSMIDNVPKILQEISFSVLCCEDFLQSPLNREAIGICGSLVNIKPQYYCLMRHSIFLLCKSFSVNDFYCKGFLSYRQENISLEDLIEFFKTTDRSIENLKLKQKAYEERFQRR